MTRTQLLSIALLASAALLGACGDDETTDPPTSDVATVETQVAPAELRAGEMATVDCVGQDAEGNALQDLSFTLRVMPDDGLSVSGLEVTAQRTGEYTIACTSGGVDDATPAVLTVLAGAPVALELALTPERQAYAIDEPITVTASASDAFGNAIEDVPLGPITVTPDGQHTVAADAENVLRFHSEGRFTVASSAADDPELSGSAELVIDQSGPVISLTSPQRGVSTDTLTQVVVSGSVQDELGTVASLTVNGSDTAVGDDGTFSTEVGTGYGVTLIDVVAADASGNTARATRAVEASEAFFEMSERTMEADGADDAVVMVLLPQAVDDDDHDEAELDDLASIFKTVLDGLELAALLPDTLLEFPCAGGTCQVSFASITSAESSVDLSLKSGRLGVGITFAMPAGAFTLVAPCQGCADDPVGLPGTLGADTLTISTDAVISVASGAVEVNAQDTVVVMEGASVAIEDPEGSLQATIDGAAAAIESQLPAALETFFAALVEHQTAGVLSSLLDVMAVDNLFELGAFVAGGAPNRIVISTVLTAIDVSPERLEVRLDGLAFPESPMRPFSSLGSLDHEGCQPAAALSAPGSAPIAIGVHDNFINQLLFAAWEGATFNVDLGPTDTGALAAEFGIEGMALVVEGHLPPIINSCERAGQVLQLGELFLDATFQLLGQPVSISLWLQLEAPVDVLVSDNEEGGSAATLTLGELDPLLVEVVRNEGLFEGDVQGLTDLLKTQLLPLLLDQLAGAARFNLPQIDLSELTEGLPAGTFVDIVVDSFERDGGYLSAIGGLR